MNAPCSPRTLRLSTKARREARLIRNDLQIDSAAHDGACATRLAAGGHARRPACPSASSRLYVRYVRALALLCECAPYVDEPDYADMIDERARRCVRHYPLVWQSDGERREIAVRAPAPDRRTTSRRAQRARSRPERRRWRRVACGREGRRGRRERRVPPPGGFRGRRGWHTDARTRNAVESAAALASDSFTCAMAISGSGGCAVPMPIARRTVGRPAPRRAPTSA